MKNVAAFVTMTLLLASHGAWAEGPLALELNKIDPGLLANALQNTQGLPSQSVVEIRGKINMGATAYYSVAPVLTDEMLASVLKPFIAYIKSVMSAQELNALAAQDPQFSKNLFGYGVRPQLKQSEAEGYSVYLFMNTAVHPKFLESFKKLTQVQFPMTTLKVRYSQTGQEQTLYPSSPATGSTVTKPLGPFQPK